MSPSPLTSPSQPEELSGLNDSPLSPMSPIFKTPNRRPEGILEFEQDKTLFVKVLTWLKGNADYCLIGFCGVFLTTCLVISLIPPPAETFEMAHTKPPDWVSSELTPSQGDWFQPAEVTPSLAEGNSDETLTPRKPSRSSQSKKKTLKNIPLIHINQASLALWSKLPGIGPKTAARILQYKKANGNFQSLEALMNVKGIGPKKFEKIKPFLKL